MNSHDAATHYNNVLFIISDIANGGIQFWNRYDLTNTFFLQISYGLYTFQNITTSLLFIFINEIFNYEISFHKFYSFFFFFIAIVIRSFGFFLLLKLISNNLLLSIIGTIIANIFFTYHLNLGLVTINLLSYLPLMLYLLLQIFYNFKLKYFTLLIFVFAICVVNSPLMTLGYFYMTIHAFLISLFLFNFKKIFNIFKKKNFINNNFSKNSISLITTAILTSLMILPYIIMIKYIGTDYYIPNSGLGETTGRLNQIMNPFTYFEKEIYTNNIGQLLNETFNSTSQNWTYSWLFLNNFTIFFSLIGIFFSKNNFKYIFIFTIIFLLFLNFDNNYKNPLAFFHYVNALTNPFSFLLRTFHMTNLIIPFFIIPLFTLGIGEVIKIYKIYSREKIVKYISILILYTVFCFLFLNSDVKFYVLLSNLLIFIVFYSLLIEVKIKRRFYFILSFFSLLLLEIFYLSNYINTRNNNHLELLKDETYFVVNSNDPKKLNFENNLYKSLPSEYTKNFISWANPLYYGFYYKITHFNNFKKSYLYNPVHKSFKNLSSDTLIQEYLINNKELISFKKNIYELKNNNFEKVLHSFDNNKNYYLINSEKDIIKYDKNASILLSKNNLSKSTHNFKIKFNKLNVIKSKIKDNFITIYYKLDDNFPENLFSTKIDNINKKIKINILYEDINGNSISTLIDDKETFNINSIKENYLILKLDKNKLSKIKYINIVFDLNYTLLNLLNNSMDNLSFIYNAEDDGYLIVNYPYDKKWNVFVNNVELNTYKANKYFFAFKINKGNNKISIKYNDEYQLKILMYISIILMFFSIIYVHYVILVKNINE